jgi:hypothetical protein
MMTSKKPQAAQAKPGEMRRFMRFGKWARIFCLWMAMAIPVLLIIDLRF